MGRGNFTTIEMTLRVYTMTLRGLRSHRGGRPVLTHKVFVISLSDGDEDTRSGKHLYTTASGDYSTAMGRYTTASGSHSTAMGHYTTAESFAETVVGQSNALGGSPSTTSWVRPRRVRSFEFGFTKPA